MDAALAHLESGFLVGNGRFTLIRFIGRGGMGVVWLARDESLREDVALKFLPPEIRFDAVALDDLRRETARARKLTHPNIIRIHDLYKDDREAFISMEFIDGANLGDLRLGREQQVFEWDFLRPLIKQLCDALDYAHGEKVVHRDLKPANMMLDSRGRLKLSDFGIAAQVSDSVSRVSMIRHGQSGTITYMSPQQMDGKLPQITDDIYALGATLYELLTGRPPFFTGDIGYQVRHLPPPPMEERMAELGVNNPVPASIAALIMACLRKAPEERPSGARAVAEWIEMRPPVAAPAEVVIPAPTRTTFSTPVISPPVERAFQTFAPQPEVEQPAPEEPVLMTEPEPTAAPMPAEPGRRTGMRGTLVFVAGALAITLLSALIVAKLFRDQRRRSREVTQPVAAETSLATVQAGFVNLFNGRDLSGWSGDTAEWTVRDGVIRAHTGRRPAKNSSCLFLQSEPLEDFELRLSYQRWSGNSGVFYRAKPLPEGAGGYQFDIALGITGNLIDAGSDRPRRDLFRVDSREVRRALPEMPKESGWHELIIIVRGPQIIQRLDGITLCEVRDEDVTAPRSGLIALEAASDTIVEFKDIRLKRLTSESPAPVSTAPVGKWSTLFNGVSLDAWRGWDAKSWIGSWSILDQNLQSLPNGTVHLTTRDQFGDFELEFEWKVAAGANSGILYRALPGPGEIWDTAPEYQIMDDALDRSGRASKTSTGSLYGMVAPKNKSLRPNGEFNSGRIVMRGSQVEHWLNGVKVLEADLSQPETRRGMPPKFDKAKWGLAPRGHIVLQHYGGEASLRNIRVRRLDGN
jgi:serine/threonine protein kinase